MGVTVSTADFLFVNLVVNWMTTYSPSGAPGRDVAYFVDFTFRDTRLPKGLLAALRDSFHFSLERNF